MSEYGLPYMGSKGGICNELIRIFPKAVNFYDLFGGSGSTLIACEKTKRRCFMMELDPHYCDVIVSRFVKYTGKTSIKRNGEPMEWTI